MDKVKITQEPVKPLGDVIGLFIGLYEREDNPDLPIETLLKHIRILLTEVKRATKSETDYLSANAELSFKNMKLKDSLSKVKDHLEGVMNPKRFVILDGPGMLQTLNQALEELK